MDKTLKYKFKRFEFKYIISNKFKEKILIDLMPYLRLDRYASMNKSKAYPVKSLYFDNKSFSSYHEKIDGLINRYKYRIRSYSFNKNSISPFFIESKGRFNNLVYKNREQLIDFQNVIKSLSGNDINKFIMNTNPHSSLIAKFTKDNYIKRMRPIALIDYSRSPYYSEYDTSFRLTIDSDIKVTESNTMFPDNYMTKKMLNGMSVMEVKFERHIPTWFHKTIEKYNLNRISISKICKGLETLGYVSDDGE